MKKMKLFCGILIGLMVFSSCSSDDDSNSDSIIVGIWKPIKRVHICLAGNEETDNYSVDCHQLSRLTFESNGTLNSMSYASDDFDNCALFPKNGTWTLTGDNLSLTLDGVTKNPTFFELTSNILRTGYYDNPINEFCDGGNPRSYFYVEYVRVE